VVFKADDDIQHAECLAAEAGSVGATKGSGVVMGVGDVVVGRGGVAFSGSASPEGDAPISAAGGAVSCWACRQPKKHR